MSCSESLTAPAPSWRFAPRHHDSGTLDALPWARRTGPYRVLGHGLALRLSHEALSPVAEAVDDLADDAAPVSATWSVVDRGVPSPREQRRRLVLYRDDVRVGFARSTQHMTGLLVRAVTAEAEATAPPDQVVLRAGAVQVGGVTVLLVGPPSTWATVALLRSGAACVATGTLSVHADGTLVPFPGPVLVGDGPAGPGWHAPSRVGGAVARAVGAPELILLLEAGNGPAGHAPVSRATACLHLARSVVALSDRPGALPLLARLIQPADCRAVSVDPDDGPGLAALVLGLLEDRG